ncbi:MAG: lytic transglycosylase domain-containing protein [Bacteroidales bacterium]|nr:lytic transglycosylase domain-containing protein [Bacteroidales bacterium]
MSRVPYFLVAFIAIVLTACITLNFSRTSNLCDEEYERAFQQYYRIFSPPVPDSLFFAGERVPLEIYHVHERFVRELLVNVYWQSNIILLMKRANRYFPIIEPILEEMGAPSDLKYLALAESGFTSGVSPAGARGFWQFLRPTAIDMRLEVNNYVDERYHLEKATRAAVRYMRRLYERFGSWTLAAAAYNTGQGNIRRHVQNQQTRDYYELHLPEETMRYVFRILALKTIFEDPMRYGIILREQDLWQPIPVRTVVVDTTINNLFAFAREQGTTFQQLRALNPWLRRDRLPNRNRKRYVISLPLDPSLLRENLFAMSAGENIFLQGEDIFEEDEDIFEDDEDTFEEEEDIFEEN